MKTKRKISTSIWTRPPKGIRAGNSPIWKFDEDDEEFNKRVKSIRPFDEEDRKALKKLGFYKDEEED